MAARPSPARALDGEVLRLARAGVIYPEIARRCGLSVNQVYRALGRAGFRLSDEERRRRVTANLARVRASPALEGKRLDALRRAQRTRAVWPDCPEHLRRRYMALRAYMPAREARAAIEREAGL